MTTQSSTEGTTDSKHWNAIRSQLKLQFPKLTAGDLYFKHGHKEEMMDKLCVKLGKTREELQVIIAAI